MRNIQEGYWRSYGIEFGNLKERANLDPAYKKAKKLAIGRTLVTDERLLNIFLIMKNSLKEFSEGHIVEFGCWKGGTSLFMASIAKDLFPGIKVYALDTFSGISGASLEHDPHHHDGNFDESDPGDLEDYAEANGLDNLIVVAGRFEDTLIHVLKQAEKISLAHIDCDVYDSVAFSYKSVYPYMVKGGYMIFDDPLCSTCIGAMKAVEDWAIKRDGLNSEQAYPHLVFRKE